MGGKGRQPPPEEGSSRRSQVNTPETGLLPTKVQWGDGFKHEMIDYEALVWTTWQLGAGVKSGIT